MARKSAAVIWRLPCIREDLTIIGWLGRVMVAMTPNSDIGDSWEWADEPRYDERFSALGIRIGVNYIVYAMTH